MDNHANAIERRDGSASYGIAGEQAYLVYWDVAVLFNFLEPGTGLGYGGFGAGNAWFEA